MKISFVIPAYNEELYIAECLESVFSELKSSDCDAEVIVVNNASTDRTGEVASSFPSVIVIDEPHKGLTHARQAGFRLSTGDLIANIDADTRLTKNWINKVLEEFSDEKLIGLSGPFIYYDASRKVRFMVRIFYYAGFLSYLINKFIFKVSSMIQGGNFILRREALEKIGGYDLKIKFYGEDTDIARRIHSVGDVKFTFSLPMYASARRLNKEGVVKTGFLYAMNYFWTIYTKKPLTNDYVDIRDDSKYK